jgi:RepB DNA-primase from phage plasmid
MFQSYAENRNPGYILVDLDHTGLQVVETMRADGLAPCVVLQTSPGNLQAWMHISSTPLEPAVANSIGRQLAQRYGGDLASTDWRHLGRLAGFTNQKPQRRNWRGQRCRSLGCTSNARATSATLCPLLRRFTAVCLNSLVNFLRDFIVRFTSFADF